MDLLLGDEPLGLGLADLGLALMIGEDHPDLRALEAGHALEPLVERQGDVDVSVGDVTGDLVHRLVLEPGERGRSRQRIDRKSTRLNSSHGSISYAVFCLKK